jgi:uncharacterized protein (DUF342 family)
VRLKLEALKVRLITDDLMRTSIPVVYEGNVEIVGTVRSGAKLQVLGDIAIYGNVEDADIQADGNVAIDGGFLGTGGGRIRCGGDFRARFIQGQRLVAEGNVNVARAVLSSMVFASGSVIVGDSDGSIVGGEVHAYGNVEAGTVGSVRPVTTRIEAGVDPLVAVAIEELEADALELTKKRLGFIKDLAAIERASDTGRSPDRAVDARAAADAIQGDIMAVGEKILGLRQGAQLNPDAVVIARHETHPPLEISIGVAKLMNESPTGPMVFRLVDNRVALHPQTEE